VKKLIGISVILVALVLGVLVGCRCSREIVSPSPVEEPSPTEVVVEPSPTEEIEEPTPTPIPPTPTPEPTSTPVPSTPTPTPEPMRYIGLPAAEVERLREQCLQENPDSFCLPLPVDPTQPGVEIFFLQAESSYSGKVFTILSIRAPAGTVFYAPCTGVYQLSHRCSKEGEELVCDLSAGEPLLRCEPLSLHYTLAKSSWLTISDFSDPSIFDRLINDWRGIPLSLGDVHFVLKSDDLAGLRGVRVQNNPGVQVFVAIYVGDVYRSVTEGDLLKDDQGRIVFVQP